MLSAGDPTLGRAGYVALETVTGTLHGREGGFAFQQYGVMRGDARELRYGVVPGSGTGALTGLEGTLTLTIDDDGTHTYDLDYTLPSARWVSPRAAPAPRRRTGRCRRDRPAPS